MKYILLLIAPILSFSQTIWDGETITFSKANNADFTQEQHQDRITADVWLTRSNSGGALINYSQESSYSRGSSPLGTYWAVGSSSDSNLQFNNFRDFDGDTDNNSPPEDINLVLKITKGTTTESDDIHIDIMFTFWQHGKTNGGGFTYTRSTDPNLSAEFKDTIDVFGYPNPTSGLVHANQEIISQIRVYDLTGKQLMESEDSSVDLSTFKNGVYLLQLYRTDSKNWVTKRVVKLE
ncbi:MAG: T9SS type A sorting domain-containing protein [Flavobacteriaceae bacterium]|nr:T9SS type A sorting domain-containing protein [Flavobacteriaceae bacterium]